jgi:hypothetical protein
VDDKTAALLVSLRAEYMEGRQRLDEAMADERERNHRLHKLRERMQIVYVRIFEIEHGLYTEDQ